MDDEEMERRFAEIAKAYGPDGSQQAPVWRGPTKDETANLLEAYDRADEEEGDEAWRSASLPEMEPWPSSVIAGALLLGTGLAIWLLVAFGVELSRTLTTMASIGAVVGLAILLFKAVTRTSPPSDGDDGAVV